MSRRVDPPRNNYRIFVGAFPGGELAERIQDLRQRCDPRTAGITPPHVTLAGAYWHSGAATPENEAATLASLREVQARIQPFQMTLGGIHTFQRNNPVVYLGVEPGDGMMAARKVLLTQVFNERPERDYTPHLTIAMRLGRAEIETLAAELRQSEWHSARLPVLIDELRLMQRGSQDAAWRCIGVIKLEM